MSKFTALPVVFVAICFASNTAFAQESFGSQLENLTASSPSTSSSQFNFSTDVEDLQVIGNAGSVSTTLFSTETKAELMASQGHQLNAQQAVVMSTLQFIGGGLIVGLIALGTLIYSTQRKNGMFGESERQQRSNW